MKQLFLNSTLNFITKYNKNYSNDELDKLRYGLEGIYLSITKLVVIFLIAIILNITWELIVLLVAFNFIRYPAFGFHANSSIECLIFSTLIFIGFPILSINVELILPIQITLVMLCILSYIIYAPADTVKRPQRVKSIRLKRKIASIVIGIAMSIAVFLVQDNLYSNLILFGMVIETIMILPITYKAFGQTYANYKKYE